jgi:hypothetical protein
MTLGAPNRELEVAVIPIDSGTDHFELAMKPWTPSASS